MTSIDCDPSASGEEGGGEEEGLLGSKAYVQEHFAQRCSPWRRFGWRRRWSVWKLRPGWQNAARLVALGLLGMILADICLVRFQKIPFTCSYLPGKSRVHMAFLGGLGVLWVASEAAMLERHALLKPGSMAIMLAVLFVVWICVRRITVALASREEQEPRFEEEESPAILGLGLYRT